jgi:hypothetical protein
VKPVIVAELTVIVHVAFDTTSPGAAVAFLGVVADGDGRPDVDKPLTADLAAEASPEVPGTDTDGTGSDGTGSDGTGSDGTGSDGVGTGRDGVGTGDDAAGELGLELEGTGKQMMIRMQVWLGVGCAAC